MVSDVAENIEYPAHLIHLNKGASEFMRLATYQHGSSPRMGIIYKTWVIDFKRAYQYWAQSSEIRTNFRTARHRVTSDLQKFLEGGEPYSKAARQVLNYTAALAGNPGRNELLDTRALIPLSEISLCAPVPKPGKIICIGGNYPTGHPDSVQPKYPVIFLKPASAVIGPEEHIQIPPVAEDVAYEAELVVVIGSRAKYLPREKALECVAGYTQANDVGARDLEQRTSQWTTGKLMDTFCPLGPVLVTPDEIPGPGNLPIVTHLNNQVVQCGNTRDMFFNIHELVSYVSHLTTLEPGDLILTGSPKTIDGKPAPALSLKPGDYVEINIGNLGILRNPVVAERMKGGII